MRLQLGRTMVVDTLPAHSPAAPEENPGMHTSPLLTFPADATFARQPSIQVREFVTQTDLMAIENLYRQSYIADPCAHCACTGGVQFSRDREWLAEHASLPGARMALAHDSQQQLVGFAQFYTDPEHFPGFVGDLNSRYAHLGKIAYMYLILVAPESRGQHIGHRLYHAAFEQSRQLGCSHIAAEIFVCPVPNSASLRFHESLDFQYTGQTVTHARSQEGKNYQLTYTQLLRSL